MKKTLVLFWMLIMGMGLSARAVFAIPPSLIYLHVYYSNHRNLFDATAQFNAASGNYDVIRSSDNTKIDEAQVTNTNYLEGADVFGQMSGDYSVPQLVDSNFVYGGGSCTHGDICPEVVVKK